MSHGFHLAVQIRAKVAKFGKAEFEPKKFMEANSGSAEGRKSTYSWQEFPVGTILGNTFEPIQSLKTFKTFDIVGRLNPEP